MSKYYRILTAVLD